jgi:hypothetical protein
MAQVTITIDDTILPRLRAAYNAETNAELKLAMIAQIKQTVKQYEIETAVQIEAEKVRLAQDAQNTAVATAAIKAENEIVIT